jgi:ubiquinone/menaquinone biosynthesis C-methylase UbiE
VHHWHDLDAGLAEVRRVLRPSGRFLAIERQVEPGATGLASHGWTAEQAHRSGNDAALPASPTSRSTAINPAAGA